MCVNDKVLHFRNEKTVVFPFYCEESNFYVQVENPQIKSSSISIVKNLPELEINEDLPILICPDILQSSQITIRKISLFNTLNTNQTLEADIKIMHFSYGGQYLIFSIPLTQDQIYRDDRFLSVIIQSNFSQNIAAITEWFARNLIFKEADLSKVFYSIVSRKKMVILKKYQKNRLPWHFYPPTY